MKWVRRALTVVIFVGALFVGWRFAAENQNAVRVHYVAGEIAEVALWKGLLGAFGLGLALGGSYGLYVALRGRLVARRFRKELGGLEAEIHQLRSLPLAPEPPAPGGTDAAPLESPPPGALGRGA